VKPGSKLSPEGQAIYDGLLERYFPASVATSATGSVALGALEVTVDLFQEQIQQASSDFKAWNFVAARDRFLNVAEKADKISTSDTAINEVRMRSRSGASASMLNLQETASARKLLEEVDERYLTEEQRANLSMMLTLAGDVDRAATIAASIPASSTEAASAVQLVALARGEVEIGEVRSTLVALKLCERQLELQNPGVAADVAMRAMSDDKERDLLANGLMCMLMASCCVSLQEQCTPAAGMSVAQLSEAAQLIEQHEPPPSMPDELRLAYVRAAFQYSQVTLDHRLQAALNEEFASDLERVIASSSELQAEDLAKDGAVSQAIGLAAGDSAGWQAHARRLHMMALGGDTQAAAKGLNELATRFPRRFPLETLACELALHEARFPEALTHAENAFAVYPNVGARLLVARAAVAADKADRALSIAPQDVSTDPAFLQVLAQASDRRADPRAADLWEKYLSYRPTNDGARISWAIALSRSGEHDRAAEVVAQIIANPPNALTLEGLVACGQLQLAATPSPESKARVRRVAELIHDRYGTDPKVQLHRFSLLAGIGEQLDVKLDYKRLEELGHVQSVDVEELLGTFRERAEKANAALKLYQEGCLTVEALIRVTNGQTASFVSDLLAGRRQLRTAMLLHREERVDLRGRRVLVSLLELVLFEHLGIFDQVVDLIGDGRLVVFRDIWEQLVEDTVFLQQVAQTEEADRLDEIARRLATTPKYELVRDGDNDDVVAASRGVPCVRLGDDANDIGWLAGVLITRAAGPIASARAFAQRHARQVPTVAADAIPTVIQMDQAVIEGLAIYGLLDAAERVFDRIIVGPASMRMLEARLNGLNDELRAMRLMQSLKRSASQARSRGVLEVVQRPRISAIESLPISEERAEWTRVSISEPIAYKQWLINESEGARITAEYVGSLVPLHPELWRTLPWPTRDAAVDAWHGLQQAVSQEWTLVELVRELTDDTVRNAALSKLRNLGFQEALDAAAVLSVAEQFGRLDIGEGGAALDRVEALITSDRDPWAGLARMRLAQTYASAIWEVIGKDDGPRAVQLTLELLDRSMSLGIRSRARMSELLIGALLLAAISDPVSALVPDETGDTMVLRKQGAVVDVWRAIRNWSEGHEDREAACRRAISYGWVKLHEYTEQGPNGTVNWAPLALATDKLLPQTNVERVPQPDAVVAILSALWRQRPLRHRQAVLQDGSTVNLEQLLEIGTARLGTREVKGVDEATARFLYKVEGRPAVPVLVPAEALLLRAEASDVRSGFARNLAAIVGPLDGRLYAELVRFAESPDDPDVQSSLAVAACTAPFRLIRDDPSLISFWGEPSNVSQQGHLATFDELCELLSEPDSLGPEYAREIKGRTERGPWATRLDAGELVQLAGRVPGLGVTTVATALVHQPPPSLWDGITDALKTAETVPVGRLAQAVAVAGLGPFLGKVEDAPPELGDQLRTMLLQLDSDAGKEFAVVEGKCLALLERVILRIAGIRPLPAHQRHWLTFRLYEWWCENSTLEDRREVSRNEVGRDDLLAFRRRTVLNVLLDVCEMVSAAAHRRPDHLAGLTDLLLQHAAKDPWTGDAFEAFWKRPQGGGWLAASIVLWISPSHFRQLPPEIRLRVFENLPVQTEPLDVHALPYVSFLDGIVSSIDNLSEEEVRAVYVWSDRLDDGGLSRLWRLHIWTGLVGRGDDSRHEALRTLVEHEANGERHVLYVGHYVGTLARGNLIDGMVEWLAKVCERGGHVAEGIVDAWRKASEVMAPVKAALSNVLLGRDDLHSQAEGAVLRDAAPSPPAAETDKLDADLSDDDDVEKSTP